jgi:hypothetical protein
MVFQTRILLSVGWIGSHFWDFPVLVIFFGVLVSGFSFVGSKFVSIVRQAWMVRIGDNGIRLVRPPRSNTLRPVSSCRVPELGVLVVGVTSYRDRVLDPSPLK